MRAKGIALLFTCTRGYTSRPLPFGNSAFGTPHHTTLHYTTPDAHVGSIWVTNTPEAKERVPQGSTELKPSPVLWCMGTNVFPQGKPTVPRNVWAIGAEI